MAETIDNNDADDVASVVSSVTNFTLRSMNDDDHEVLFVNTGMRSTAKKNSEDIPTPLSLQTEDLVGREKELKLLLDSWDRLVVSDEPNKEEEEKCAALEEPKQNQSCSQSSSSQASSSSNTKMNVVLIHGESGVGKSRLVESLRARVSCSSVATDNSNNSKIRERLFVSGKFDQQWSQRFPFHALVDALSDLSDKLVFGEDCAGETVARYIEEKMDVEDWILFQQFVSIPTELRSLVFPQDHKEENNLPAAETSDFSTEHSLRMQRACRLFLEGVSSWRPLVICLDDVQWTDNECIELIRSILFSLTSGAACRRILFLLIFRDGYNIPKRVTKGIRDDSILNLQLKRLDEAEVGTLLSRLMSIPSQDMSVQRLTRILFEKTGGNPLFVVQLLELIKVKGMLVWSPTNRRWEFDEIGGITRLDVSEGVVASVMERLTPLSAISKSILAIAAHLGFEFKGDLLALILSCNPKVPFRTFPSTLPLESTILFLKKTLIQAEEQRLIIAGKDDNTFYFMHDRVQECFHGLVSTGSEKECLFLHIGRCLRDSILCHSNEDEADPYILFTVVDCLNRGRAQLSDESESYNLIGLNEDAADNASSSCSFLLASSYLEVAISLLPEPEVSWRQHYTLSLRLHEKIAKAYCNFQRVEEAHAVLDMIMARARNIADKQTAHHIRFLVYELQGKNKETLAAAIVALREIGYAIKENPSMGTILLRVCQVKWMMTNRRLNDLLKMKVMTDVRAFQIVSWLRTIVLHAIVMQNDAMMLLCMVEMFRFSLMFGRTAWTPSATAAFGIVEFKLFGNLQRGSQHADLAIQMLDLFNAESDYCCTHLFASIIMLPWRDPPYSIVPAVDKAFELGIRYGQPYHACKCASGLGFMLLHGGQHSLVETEWRTREIAKNVKKYTRENATALMPLSFCQAAQNLMGMADDPLILSGDAMSEESVMEQAAIADLGNMVTAMHFLKFELASHFRALDVAKNLLHGLEKKGRNAPPWVFAVYIPYQFFACTTYIDLTRRNTGRPRKYTKRAVRCYNNLSNLSSGGSHFARALAGILTPEIQALKTGKTVNYSQFTDGIENALQDGYICWAAIGCERAGNALLDERGIFDHDVYGFLIRGLRLNEQWEAFGKLEWYKETYFSTYESEQYPMPSTIIEQ